MKAWEFETIRRAVQGRWLVRGNRLFNGHVCTDSRKAAPGDLFVALCGRSHDAHIFLDTVIEAGVAGILAHRELSAQWQSAAQARGVTILMVDETVLALNRLAAAYRKEMRAKVIAVSGSNGKTSTKRIIHALLATRFQGHASPKSFNNNIGMPLTILEVEAQHEFAVLEIGTNAPGEMAALGQVARPDIAVITSIGLEHLEQLGNLEGVAREEAAIAAFVTPGGTLVLPAEAPELLACLKHIQLQRITVGFGAADLQATDIQTSLDGSSFALNGRGRFVLPLLGRHNVTNAVQAIAVARRMGLSDEQIQVGLSQVTPAPMRLELMRIGPWTILNDAYNANPTSMEAALETFLSLPWKKRRVAILGDMLELGAASEAMHRRLGAQAAARGIDLLIAIGPAMRWAVESAKGIPVSWFASAKEAGAALSGLLAPEDALLLKGSRGMGLEKLLEFLR